MKTNYTFFLGLVLSIFVSSCADLDDVAFFGEKIDQYLFDDYQNPNASFTLDQSYNIPDSNIHLFTMQSKLATESSSTTIYGVYVGAMSTISQDTIIVYMHGQGAHMDAYWHRTKLLANTGGKNRYGVLTIDYRGFGLSEGKSSEESLYEDARTALRWLKNQGVDKSKVMMYGFSLGCIPSIKLCADFDEYKPSKLMIEAPIGSVQNITEESLILNVQSTFFTNNEFDNAGNMQRVSQPMQWLHGTADDYIKIDQGELVYSQYNGPYKEAHRIQGAEHGNIPLVMGINEYKAAVLDFITK